MILEIDGVECIAVSSMVLGGVGKVIHSRVFVFIFYFDCCEVLLGVGYILCIWLVCVLESLGRVHFLGVDFTGCLEMDCAGGVLVVFYFCLREDCYRLL